MPAIDDPKQAERERLANRYDQGDADTTWMIDLARDIREGRRDDLLPGALAADPAKSDRATIYVCLALIAASAIAVAWMRLTPAPEVVDEIVRCEDAPAVHHDPARRAEYC